MLQSTWVVAKKLFSLTLILNCLVSLACIAQIMFNSYRSFPYWQPYAPYLVNGSVLFLVVIAAVVNIFPTASIGRKLHTGRFLFHHYVYGFVVIVLSALFVVAFTSVSLQNLFLVYTSNVAVNAGRFLTLAGFTLFLDDLPDVSKKVESALNWFKSKAYRGRRAIYWLQLISGLATLYVFAAVCLWTTKHPSLAVDASFMIGTFLATGVTSLVCIKRRMWLEISA